MKGLFSKSLLDVLREQGWFMQRQQVCNNAQDCLLSKAHEILEGPALGFLLLTMYKAVKCFEGERIT